MTRVIIKSDNVLMSTSLGLHHNTTGRANMLKSIITLITLFIHPHIYHNVKIDTAIHCCGNSKLCGLLMYQCGATQLHIYTQGQHTNYM
jgi:hypothetical protein